MVWCFAFRAFAESLFSERVRCCTAARPLQISRGDGQRNEIAALEELLADCFTWQLRPQVPTSKWTPALSTGIAVGGGRGAGHVR